VLKRLAPPSGIALLAFLTLVPRPARSNNCRRLADLGRGAVDACTQPDAPSLQPDLAADRAPDGPAQKTKDVYNNKILQTAYTTLPDLSKSRLLGLEDVPSRMTGRDGLKTMYTFGTVAMCDFIPDPASPFTGLWKGGSALMRISAKGPPSKAGNTPGVALKFMVKGSNEPRDIVLTHDRQDGTTNVFDKPVSNILPEPKNPLEKLVVEALAKMSNKDPLRLKVDAIGEIDSSGNPVKSIRNPYQVILMPTHQDGIPADSRNDFRSDLAKVKPGTAIYQVYAIEKPDGPVMPVGRIVTRSNFVASTYGDESLRFKH
jgi:hypothetical protein